MGSVLGVRLAARPCLAVLSTASYLLQLLTPPKRVQTVMDALRRSVESLELIGIKLR
jgi:hypothetical protein